MDRNPNPYLYQLFHWWHWLSYGQNAAVIQALGAIIAACAATVAGLYAVRAFRATILQLRIAREQLELAHEQFAVERSRYAEQRRASALMARAVYLRTVAEEEEARPRFNYTNGYMPAAGIQGWDFRNLGSSAATELTVIRADNQQILAQNQYVAAANSIRLMIDPESFSNSGLLFRFKTAFGSTWKVLVRLNLEEEVVSVDRPYEPIVVEPESASDWGIPQLDT